MEAGPTPIAALRALFDAAMERPAHERDAWIASNVPDAVLRARLARLVAADAERGALDDAAAAHAARMDLARERPADSLLGQRFAGFRLERLIGQGGMATVFLGVREGADFEQRAAVKLLRRGLYSELEQQLFRRERRVLAALSHPGIARLIDGGVTDAGVPFLVLEYVDGVPITQFASERGLDVRQRVALVAEVARAVAAAHRALVVHRDLKPANILVDRDGRARLLDFGVAKLLADEDDASARTGSRILTPAYAAPEQLLGTTVTTAADVYALGVVLHELLLGERPHPDVRPSDRVRGATALPPASLRSALRGDLDNVLSKALADDPGRRYPDAAALADDLERFLASRPVLAHPPSRWYRTRKFVRRHRGGVAVTAMLAVALFASLALALWQARAAGVQAGIAQAQAARAGEVQDFLESLFGPVADGASSAGTPTVLELVQRGAARIEAEYPDDPLVRADLLALFARLHNALGANARAEPLATAAVAANIAAYGEADARSLDAGLVRAQVLRRLGQYDAALAELARWRAGLAARGVHGMDAARVIDAISIVRMDQGMPPAEAIALKREALAERERDPTTTEEDRATGYNNLGVAYQYAGDFASSLGWYRKALAVNERLRPGSRATAVSLLNVGMVEGYAGRFREAEPVLRRSLETFARIPLERHPSVVGALNQLCSVQAELEEFAAAQATCERAVALAGEVAGPTHATTIYALTRRASAAYSAGRFADGDADLARAVAANAETSSDRPYNEEIIDSVRLRRLRWSSDGIALREAALRVLDAHASDRQGTSPGLLMQEAYAALGCARAPVAACAGHGVGRVMGLLGDARYAASAQRLSARNVLAEIALEAGQPRDALAVLDGMPGPFVAELGVAHSQVGLAHLLRARALVALGRRDSAATERAAAARVAAALPAGHPVRAAIEAGH